MRGNSFGQYFVIHSFGESHGRAMGVVVDGCPAGVEWSSDVLLDLIHRRRPGLNNKIHLVSKRDESDVPEVLSGVFDGKTLGTPIALIVYNQDCKSEDYDEIKSNPRKGHADDIWSKKYSHWDWRGGGRSSGRETLSRVLGGAIAKMVILKLSPSLKVKVFAQSVGTFKLSDVKFEEALRLNPLDLYQFPSLFPDQAFSKDIVNLLKKAQIEGESYGGILQVCVQGVPFGLGQPVFKKLKNELASAYMSIGATCFVELGKGLDLVSQEGTKVHGNTNQFQYGGIRGGISTGEDIYLSVGVKPPASIQNIARSGRHDPCIISRVASVLEAMTYLVLVDQMLCRRLDNVE